MALRQVPGLGEAGDGPYEAVGNRYLSAAHRRQGGCGDGRQMEHKHEPRYADADAAVAVTSRRLGC